MGVPVEADPASGNASSRNSSRRASSGLRGPAPRTRFYASAGATSLPGLSRWRPCEETVPVGVMVPSMLCPFVPRFCACGEVLPGVLRSSRGPERSPWTVGGSGGGVEGSVPDPCVYAAPLFVRTYSTVDSPCFPARGPVFSRVLLAPGLEGEAWFGGEERLIVVRRTRAGRGVVDGMGFPGEGAGPGRERRARPFGAERVWGGRDLRVLVRGGARGFVGRFGLK